MDFEIIDNVYRSRTTLLTILEMRGYNVEPFRKFSPAEIEVAGSISETFAPLGFVAKHKDFPDQSVDVRYARVSRQKIMSFFEDIPANSQTEVIVMTCITRQPSNCFSLPIKFTSVSFTFRTLSITP